MSNKAVIALYYLYNMRPNKCNTWIGFNDWPVVLIGIPVMAFIVSVVFFHCRFVRPPYLTWDKYLATLTITTVIWLGNRYIMIWSRRRHPNFSDVRKRILRQAVFMVLFTVVLNSALSLVFDDVFRDEGVLLPYLQSVSDKLISANSAALFCTIMVMAVYESVYFMSELRKSVQETESLKRESLSAQLNALRTQVNPHFLFNNLNTLVSVIPENQQQAVDFVQQLSKVYRHILDVRDEESIPLKDELDVLRAYSFLLKTRFGDNIQVQIDVPAEKLQQKIVPLSLQILMENAIKHNIVSASRPLKIDVFAQNGSLVVRNNLQMKNQLSESTGIGLENIRNRYRLLGNRTVEVTNNGEDFTVSVPLIG
jgi:two-component system, LytTR family, sensor kinase